jgi:aspartate/methionine/tyrosine aminotransferase
MSDRDRFRDHAAVPSRISTPLRPFGRTIFAEMSRLAAKHSAVNLGQGFPDFAGPEFVKEAAIEAMRSGRFDQYSRMSGSPDLAAAIAERYLERGLRFDPDSEVTVTCGCTEAIPAAILGLLDPGDEAVLIAPFYDSYPAAVAMAGGVARFVRLEPPDFRLRRESLEAACSERTRLVVVNTPHNPTGRVFDAGELEAIADVCRRRNAILISDEVYEDLVFEGEHRSLATLPGMAERTVTLSSLGKTFSLTGWKIGWAAAPEDLSAAVRAAHQFLTFAAPTPLQQGAAVALREGHAYVASLRERYRRCRDLFCDGLERLGFGVHRPAGTYFVMADHSRFGYPDDHAFCKDLVESFGVAAIPPSVFYDEPSVARSLVRFAFCKQEDTLQAALSRMERLAASAVDRLGQREREPLRRS